jgi:hypothetical protein
VPSEVAAVVSLSLVGIVALTSLGAYLIATRACALSRHRLPSALAEAMECLGLGVLFFIGNLATGVALILGVRGASGRFVSIYWLNDITLVALSLLQGLVAHCWRRTRS